MVDAIVPEPLGGAQRDHAAAAAALAPALAAACQQLAGMDVDELLERRYQRLMSYGSFQDGEAAAAAAANVEE